MDEEMAKDEGVVLIGEEVAQEWIYYYYFSKVFKNKTILSETLNNPLQSTTVPTRSPVACGASMVTSVLSIHQSLR